MINIRGEWFKKGIMYWQYDADFCEWVGREGVKSSGDSRGWVYGHQSEGVLFNVREVASFWRRPWARFQAMRYYPLRR